MGSEQARQLHKLWPLLHSIQGRYCPLGLYKSFFGDGWALSRPKVCGVALGVEPRTSCMIVKSVTILLRGPDGGENCFAQ